MKCVGKKFTYTMHVIHMEAKGHSMKLVLPLWVLGIDLRSLDLCHKHFYALDHLASTALLNFSEHSYYLILTKGLVWCMLF